MSPIEAKSRQTPGSRSAGSTCKLTTCSFCALSRGRNDLFVEQYGSSPELTIPNICGDLMVMMDSFPIGHQGGHVLIVPRRHMTSLAQFTDASAIFDAMATTKQVLCSIFPDHWLFAFEHGPGELNGQPVKCGGCHVDHAHGHVLVLPREVDFESIRNLTERTLTELRWDLDAQTFESDSPFLGITNFVGAQPYLQIGVLHGEQDRVFTYRQESATQSIPSQLLRKIVSTVAGKESPIHWNWKIAVQRNISGRLTEYRNAAIGFQVLVAQAVDSLKKHRNGGSSGHVRHCSTPCGVSAAGNCDLLIPA